MTNDNMMIQLEQIISVDNANLIVAPDLRNDRKRIA